MGLVRRLVSGGIWAFSAKAGSGVLTLALTAYVTRLLDPHSVGVLFLGFSIVVMLSVVVRLGLDQLGIKLIGEAISAGAHSLARVIAFRLIRIVAVFAVAVGSAVYLYFDEIAPLFFAVEGLGDGFRFLFSAWVVLVPLQLLFAELFRAYRRVAHASVFSGGTLFGGFGVGLVVGAGLLLFHLLGYPLTLNSTLTLILMVTLVFLVMEFRLIWRLSRSGKGDEQGADLAVVGHGALLRQGLPFLVIMLSLLSLVHMDTVILGFYRPEEEVAIYAAATRIVKLMVMSLIVAYEVAAPVIVELNAAGERERLQEILRVIATIAAIPAVVALAFFIFAPSFVLGFLYGDYYREGAEVLAILSIGQLVNVWTGLSGYTLNMLGFQKLNMYVYSTVSILALILCGLLADEYGPVGVAVVIACAWVLQNIATVILARRYTGIWTHAGFFILPRYVLAYLRGLKSG